MARNSIETVDSIIENRELIAAENIQEVTPSVTPQRQYKPRVGIEKVDFGNIVFTLATLTDAEIEKLSKDYPTLVNYFEKV